MRAFDTRPLQRAEWHLHPVHELCLAADAPTTIGKAAGQIGVAANTLCFFPARERHCYWNDRAQAPRFWVIHFAAGRSGQARFPFLRARGADAGAWPLSDAQLTAFKTHFLRMLREHAEPRPLHLEAQAGWLQLLLVQIQRWAIDPKSTLPIPERLSPGLMRMWQLVNECVGAPDALARRLRQELPNHDSLRHAFKQTFGCSPHELRRKLRLQHAKNLLLETPLSIKEIAGQLGYSRQHEFARTFNRQTGLSPTGWRANPIG